MDPRLPQKACTEERLLEFPVRRMCVVFTGAARRILNIELALPVYLLGNSSIWELAQTAKSFEDRSQTLIFLYSAVGGASNYENINCWTSQTEKSVAYKKTLCFEKMDCVWQKKILQDLGLKI